MNSYVTSLGRSITPGKKIGKGGEGIVHLIGKGHVAKIYHKPDKARAAKIAAMLAHPPHAPKGHPILAWPTESIHIDSPTGPCCGFIMPAVPDPVNLIEVISLAGRRRSDMGWVSVANLMAIAQNIAFAVETAHDADYVIGDINDQNVLINRSGWATLIDTDSFQVPNPKGRAFRCVVGVVDYTAPEIQGRPRRDFDSTAAHDRFGLAVLIYKLVIQGDHPFVGIGTDGKNLSQLIREAQFVHSPGSSVRPPPTSIPLSALSHKLERLFERCFVDGMKSPDLRPSPAEWRKALAEAQQKLQVCRVNDRHAYDPRNDRCPWCAIGDRVKLGGGNRHELFPETHEQVTIKRKGPRKLAAASNPTAPASSASIPRQFTLGTSSLPSASGQNFTPPPSTAPPPVSRQASSSSQKAKPKQPATIGDVLIEAGAQAVSSWLVKKLGLGSAAGIGPGRWKFTLAQSPQAYGTIVRGALVTFSNDGSFFGNVSVSPNPFVPFTRSSTVSGSWLFENSSASLVLDAIIEGQSIRSRFAVVGQGPRGFTLQADDGATFYFERA